MFYFQYNNIKSFCINNQNKFYRYLKKYSYKSWTVTNFIMTVPQWRIYGRDRSALTRTRGAGGPLGPHSICFIKRVFLAILGS